MAIGYTRYVFHLCVATSVTSIFLIIVLPRINHLNFDKNLLRPFNLNENRLPRFNYSKNLSETTTERPVIFAYLTQTESCLYHYLQLPQQLGDSASCQCDVLVLSFKQKCNDLSLPHVQYIFDPSTTWTTGRNLLYRTIMEREQKYLYYTFFDDDAQLVFREKSQENLTPFRQYEKSLLVTQPPIAASWRESLKYFRKYFDGKCTYPKKPDFLSLEWYDAMFNSFHHEVIDYLLPYYDKMDNVSLWYSHLYLMFKTDLMFPGQLFINLNVIAENTLHRPYTRKDYNSEAMRVYLADLEKEIPAKYREQLQPKIDSWVGNPHEKENPVYRCPLFPTVRTPLVPYAYLDSA